MISHELSWIFGLFIKSTVETQLRKRIDCKFREKKTTFAEVLIGSVEIDKEKQIH